MEFYQYYVRYYADWSMSEYENQGIVFAEGFYGALEEIELMYRDIQDVEIKEIGGYLNKEIIDSLTWRETKDFTEIEDCDSCDQCKIAAPVQF